ncbi:MAG: transcription-repair coupling factor [Flavobacteriaceae bacterium]|nr:transcription-repair coupling factor [Flavobacteriaceae bacterium]
MKGLVGSGKSYRIASLFKKSSNDFFVILNNQEEATYYLNDFENILSKDEVLFFPSSFKKEATQEIYENSNILLRSEVLKKIKNKNKSRLIVSYSEAIFEKIISQNTLNKKSLKINKEKSFSLDSINELLFKLGFNRVPFVSTPGEFSIRGGILDIFSFSYNHPYRLEFFDNKIERICSFNVETQLSINAFDSITIIPNTSNIDFSNKRDSIIDFFDENTLYVFNDFDQTMKILNQLYSGAEKIYNSKINNDHAPETLFINDSEIIEKIKNKNTIIFEPSFHIKKIKKIQINQNPQPSFNKKFNLLIDHLNNNSDKGFENVIFCSNENQAKRFHDIFQEMEIPVKYKTIIKPLYKGFEDEEAQISFFTDHQIFERYHKYKLRNNYSNYQNLSLKEINKLNKGDYVTHIDHGIGKFAGLLKIEVNNSFQEAVKILYGDSDILYLSIHSLYKISKYNGKDGAIPKIYKLGSKVWKNLKINTKKKVKKIAFDLIKLYAKRKEKIGFSFKSDSSLQWELEASFLFEDTPDQTKTTNDVKSDMESPNPMDRLICGDVGFGKTEIAIRAAFKAVDNNKQVAVLVPTTILAFQHYNSFSERLKDFPITVDYLNRFRSSKEKKDISEKLTSGKIDILIGTHQIVNNIFFKDLGLLIVDEEQKFGVSVKEKLRNLKINVDVLTLTATPIPRTLQFSLISARDLSIITTPPPNRYPIQTEIIRFDENIIKEAIIYEMQRGGQVFFIHNLVNNISEVFELIQRLVPDAKIVIGHGQMQGKKLEKTMLEFIIGKHDVLIATTIIENGLDVPNANTIFINNANNFGLSDLHQMRGRVGRSNKKAFCYLITPENSNMTKEASKRIKAIEENSNLGAGINIAMKDLEIRGAGNLLGADQSGFINEMGFETYQKILKEAIDELKEKEFKELYKSEKLDHPYFIKDIQIDTDLEILIPDNYINDTTERLSLYQELSVINDKENLENFKLKLKDRFGIIPNETNELIETIKLKWILRKIAIEKIVIKKNQFIGYFINNQNNPFFSSNIFSNLISKIQNQNKVVRIKEKETKKGLRLLLIIDNIENIKNLNKVINNLLSS